MKLHTLTIAACFILLIGSCSENETTKSIIGFKPVYGGIEDIQKLITTTTAQPLKSVGKIYTYGNLLLINEVGKGVHVYDNQDPSAPVNLKFIAIPGNVDVALKDGYLYADLNFGIITLDISDLDHVTLTHLNTAMRDIALTYYPTDAKGNYKVAPPPLVKRPAPGEKPAAEQGFWDKFFNEVN